MSSSTSLNTHIVDEDEKIKLEMLSRNTFENIQKKSKLRLRRKTVFYIIILLLFCICIAAVLFTVFFKVNHITVTGTTIYDDWRIIEASGIKAGQNSYSIDKEKAEQTIISEFTYIRSVDIIHKSPSSLTLNITENTAAYYFTLDGEYFILSDSLKVLEIIQDIDKILTRHPDILRIYVSGISVAIVGKTIEFVNENYYSYAVETLKVFSECSMSQNITKINCRDKFDVYFIYDNRFKIEVGNTNDLSMKLAFASAIINRLSSSEKGIINVENQSAFFISQTTIDESETQ